MNDVRARLQNAVGGAYRIEKELGGGWIGTADWESAVGPDKAQPLLLPMGVFARRLPAR
jgi:hypothetical protein